MKTGRKHIMLSLALLTILCACQKSDLTKLSFEKQLEQKYESYVQKELANCKEEIVRSAEIHVDSVVDRLLKKDLIDTLEFPEKPIRPVRPDSNGLQLPGVDSLY